jgi:hypothetical protein
MADASRGLGYHHLVNVAQWHIGDDNYVAARAAIVNAHHRHPMAAIWDDGTSLPSDGPSYTRVISATMSEAPYVLDGLHHHAHQTDLRILEHYTDTAGATDHVFGLCYLLDYRFAPRIKDLKDRKLYTVEKPSTWPLLAPLIGDTVDTAAILGSGSNSCTSRPRSRPARSFHPSSCASRQRPVPVTSCRGHSARSAASNARCLPCKGYPRLTQPRTRKHSIPASTPLSPPGLPRSRGPLRMREDNA